jgi:hypothetical protein
MNDKSPADDILALARAQNEAYLAAYREGYQRGFNAAIDSALKILNRPITEGKKP